MFRALRCLVLLVAIAPGLSAQSPRAIQLVNTQHSGIADSIRVVIRDSVTWQQYWAAVHRPFMPPPAPPEIDFRREMVLLAALGTRSSGGFGIRIDSVTADSARLIVQVRRTVPGSGCVLPSVVTQPVDLVRVPLSGLPVSFAERLDRADCSAARHLIAAEAYKRYVVVPLTHMRRRPLR